MSVQTEIPADEPTIRMSRLYDAPRDRVWAAMTQPRHVREWWGGPGVSNPVCEMDVRPGGMWTHVMRFADGFELRMSFVFVEVEKPARIAWRPADDEPPGGLPAAVVTVTLDDLDSRTRWTMVARFKTLAARDAAVAMGFGGPIKASSESLTDYLTSMDSEGTAP